MSFAQRSLLSVRGRQVDPCGFTLIDLLVVVAIIGLLVALGAAGLSRAKSRAQSIVCLNNLGQIGMAFLMYTHEANDCFCTTVISNFYAVNNWVGNGYDPNYDVGRMMANVVITPPMKPLNAYLAGGLLRSNTEIKVAHCPGDNRAYGGLGAYRASGTSYVSSHYPPLNDLKPIMRGRLEDKTRRITSVEPASLVAGAEHFASAYVQNQPLETFYPLGEVPWFHQRPEQFNVLFVDGHTRSIRQRMGQVRGSDAHGEWHYDESDRPE